MTEEEELTIVTAITEGNVAFIKELLGQKTDWLHLPVFKENNRKLLAIHYACQEGKFEIVKLLLEQDASLLNARDSINCSPLHYAAGNGYEHIVDYLTNLNANLSVPVKYPDHVYDGYHPIHWAVVGGHHLIVQCLIDKGAEINMRVNKEAYHLIHLASINGYVEVVKVLMNKNPDLLNITDHYGQTPFLLAAANGYTPVVEYFIEAKALLSAVANQFHPNHGKSALERAIEGRHYGTAYLLILKMTAHQSKDAILSFVQTGEQALEFMIIDPSLIKIFLQNERIISLIRTAESHVTEEFIEYYRKSRERRFSFYAQIKRTDGTISIFNPKRVLGEGAEGYVRLFEDNETNKKFAVKALKAPIPFFQRAQYSRVVNREATFERLAYPQSNGPSRIFEFKDQNAYTNRRLMPYVEGETAFEFIPKIENSSQLAKVVLEIAKEVNRIHGIGIIHGDLGPTNILINYENDQFTIRLIDFALAYSLKDPTVTYVKPRLSNWYPPERVNLNNSVVLPNSNQDIYSLGYLFNMVLSNHPLYSDLIFLFPSINTFISEAQNPNPIERPSVLTFINALIRELSIEDDLQSKVILTIH